MITIYHRTVREHKLQTPDMFKTGSWLHVENPTDEEITRLAAEHKLEEGLLRDALDYREVPRMESEQGIVYIYTRVPLERDERVSTYPLLIALGSDFVLTVSKEKLSFLEPFFSGKTSFYTTQKVKLFLQLFGAINAGYTKRLAAISRQVRERRVRLERIQSRDIVQFVGFEDILNDFLSALVPTSTALQTLLNGRSLKLYEHDKDMVEDLFLSTGQLIETARATLKTIVNVRDAYSTIVTHDLNRVMRVLTSLTILLTVPTMIFSFYGMNVTLPHTQSPASWLAILSATFLVSAGLLFVFIKKRWL